MNSSGYGAAYHVLILKAPICRVGILGISEETSAV
jgi:hypothetical protein